MVFDINLDKTILGPINIDSFQQHTQRTNKFTKAPAITIKPTPISTTFRTFRFGGLPPGYVHAEWNGGHGIFHGMEVELREDVAPTLQIESQGATGNDVPVPPRVVTASATSSTTTTSSTRTASQTTVTTDPQVVQVRIEEIVLVVLVFLIWIGAITLFFNRWGKIRMLEPYQPKFHQQPHRPSCPLAPLSPPSINHQVSNNNHKTTSNLTRNQKTTAQRMSFSKYNVNALTDPLSALPSPIIRRPRQNSVFLGSSIILNPPPRRVQSATDLHNMVARENSPTASLTGSVIPIINRDRRPSLINIERPDRPIIISRRRPSITIERPPYQCAKGRRSSCFVERIAAARHKNFYSFEHAERTTPVIINEQRSCSYVQPTISLETPLESLESSEQSELLEQFPSLQHEGSQPAPPPPPPPPSQSSSISTCATTIKSKISRSFEHPTTSCIRPKPKRMANSLDVTSSFSMNRKCSIPEEQNRSIPVIIQMEDIQVTAPLLESIKSSDV